LDWNAALYEQHHSFVWRSAEDLIALLAPRAGERILDVGCGTGHLSVKLAEAGAEVTGIDKSPVMIEQARTAFPQVRFLEADILDFQPAQPFDAIFSNAALHWVQPPDEAARRMFAALVPGGRLVAEFGGCGNTASLLAAAASVLEGLHYDGPASSTPWYFPSIAEYSRVLDGAGFEVVFALLFDRPTPLEGGEQGFLNWMTMFGGQFTPGAPEVVRTELAQKMCPLVRPRLFRDGTWQIDYRRLRICARRPLAAAF
jgi:trans-aconitate methyltransferase